VTKVDYRNGKGDGHIVWRLGQDGDFTVNSTDSNPWFSHQHNAHYIDDSTLILFDNGNTRHANDPNAHSRGQVWTLDEKTMAATLVFNADLGNYSDRVGAAQVLSNGNYCFTSGAQGEPPDLFGQSIEVRPDGTQAYVLQLDTALNRSFRVRTLYEGNSDVPQRGDGGSRRTTHNGSGPGHSFVPLVARMNAPGIEMSPLGTSGFEERTPVGFPADAALVWDQNQETGVRPFLVLSGRSRGTVRDYIFASFRGNWVGDLLVDKFSVFA